MLRNGLGMPVVEATVEVALPAALAFAVSQTTGDIRLRWDPFIRRQRFLDGALRPDKGVRTLTIHRLGFRMVSEYVSFRPPSNVGMRMTEGSWFFERLAGGWRFDERVSETGEVSTHAIWRYNFTCRPKLIAPVAERIGAIVLGRDIRKRIDGFARGCADPVVLAAAQASIDERA